MWAGDLIQPTNVNFAMAQYFVFSRKCLLDEPYVVIFVSIKYLTNGGLTP